MFKSIDVLIYYSHIDLDSSNTKQHRARNITEHDRATAWCRIRTVILIMKITHRSVQQRASSRYLKHEIYLR
jgi:hypothetical protein